MNLSTKQKQSHGYREQTCGCQVGGGGEREGLGVQDQYMQITIPRMGKRQGPIAGHKELYSISCGKP